MLTATPAAGADSCAAANVETIAITINAKALKKRIVNLNFLAGCFGVNSPFHTRPVVSF